MGYPMTWNRLVNRNLLLGNYGHSKPDDANAGTPLELSNIAGDMRRLEADTLDDRHLELYAKVAGCDRLVVDRIFRAFFAGDVWTRVARVIQQ